MPATKAKLRVTRTLRPKKKLTQCRDCRSHALKALAWACAMEKLEMELEMETARLLSVAAENAKLSNLAHNRWIRLCVEEEGAIQSWAMLDVMAKALERANLSFDIRGRILESCNIQLARKASVIKAYEAAWSKGQNEPYVNGGCAK